MIVNRFYKDPHQPMPCHGLTSTNQMYLRVEHSIAGFTILQLALTAIEGGLFFFTLIRESVNCIKLSVSIKNTNTSNNLTV